jgi:phospholipid/cholesterol/gamma-HCH transport system substrate-binding protein
MESNVNYTLVGLFVIILSIVLIGCVLWLTVGGQTKSHTFYLVYFEESVSGLYLKSTVSYRGVNVGQVADIQLDPEDLRRVKVTLSIEDSVPIKQDTVATLSIQGLTGLATVELSGGSPESPPLQSEPEQTWPVIKSSPSLVQRLDDAFSQAMTQFNKFSERLDLLLSSENQRSINQTLSSLNTISTTVAARSDTIDQTLRDIATVTGTLAAGSGQLDQALSSAAQTLGNSVAISNRLNDLMAQIDSGTTAVTQMAQTITSTSQNLNSAVIASRKDLQQLVQRTTPELNALLLEMGRLTDSMQRFMNELEQNPQMLITGKPRPRPGPGE